MQTFRDSSSCPQNRPSASSRVERFPRLRWWLSRGLGWGITGWLLLHPNPAAAQLIILSDGFEAAWPGVWTAGNTGSGPTWRDVNSLFGGEGTHGGGWKAYCAATAYPFGSTEPNPTYTNKMTAYMETEFSLRGCENLVLLRFWSKIPSIESCCDAAKVFANGTLVWSNATPQAAWTEVTVDLSGFVGGLCLRANLSSAQLNTDLLTIKRISGAVGIGTNNPQSALHVAGTAQVDASLNFGASTRQMLNLYSSLFGIGVQDYRLYFRTGPPGYGNGFEWYSGGQHTGTAGDPGPGGTTLMSLNSGGLTVNGTFVSASDRAMKQDFEAVNSRDVLEKVAALPLTRWRYTNDTTTVHLGPMAQDFRAAFGLGPDDEHIATVDADGVALAAIQGLNQKLEETRAENVVLKARLEKLERLLQAQNGGAR